MRTRQTRCMRVEALQIDQLDEARRLLAAACAFDRAADVAREKLFGAGHARLQAPQNGWVTEEMKPTSPWPSSKRQRLATSP